MKDAVLTSKCCFKSFCDKCILQCSKFHAFLILSFSLQFSLSFFVELLFIHTILLTSGIRDHIISKSICVCGATNILADDLLPNKTLRDTINRILESGNSSAENAGSTFQVQGMCFSDLTSVLLQLDVIFTSNINLVYNVLDMESARCPQPKIPSPTMSAASKGEQIPSPGPVIAETPQVQEAAVVANPVIATQQPIEKVRTAKVADVSEATHESISVKEPASQGSAPLVEEEVQQKLASGASGEAGNVYFDHFS